MDGKDPMDPDKRKLMKQLGLATAAGGVGLSSDVTSGFLSSSATTTASSSPSIDEISIETAKHPSKPLIAYTSNVYSGSYIGLYLSKDTSSTSESPTDPSVLAKPNEYGIWGLEWVDSSTLEYQEGLVTKTSNLGSNDDLLHTRATQQRGRKQLMEEGGTFTAGSLPHVWREMLKALTELRIPDPAAIEDKYGTSVMNPYPHPRDAYCIRNAPKFRNSGGGGGGGGSDRGDWNGGSYNCGGGGGGSSDGDNDDDWSGGWNGGDETTTTTTTTTTATTTTTTTTTTYNPCERVHELSIWAPNVRKALDGPWAFSNFKFNCDKKQRTLMTIPILNKVIHKDCNGENIKINEIILWIGIDLKAIAENRTGCNLFVGVSEKFGNGTVEESACTNFCNLGDKLAQAVTAGAEAFTDHLREVATDLSYWTETNVDVEVQAEVLEPLIYIGLVALLIVAVGIGLSIFGPTVPILAAIAALGLGSSLNSGLS